MTDRAPFTLEHPEPPEPRKARAARAPGPGARPGGTDVSMHADDAFDAPGRARTRGTRFASGERAAPFDQAAAYAACRAESVRLRARHYARFGVVPTGDAAVDDAAVAAVMAERFRMVGEGWTFVDGHPRRLSEWMHEQEAARAAEAETRKPKARPHDDPTFRHGDPNRGPTSTPGRRTGPAVRVPGSPGPDPDRT